MIININILHMLALCFRGRRRVLDIGCVSMEDKFDAIMMIDLMHHINDESKEQLLATCAGRLNDGGRLIIKDVTTRPFLKLVFTWALDVLVTQGFDMWYWSEDTFYPTLGDRFNRVDTFPISDWLPYPHIIYLCENM
jgi:cyclopropane fatty-acyl-phospholipid synthase-like methyltransferase